MNPPKIIFIVPTYNRIQIVIKTVEINKGICARYGASMIVIDNASDDGTYDQLNAHHSDIKILKNNKNIGLKGSFKRAFVETSGTDRLLIFLSDEDIIFEPGLNFINEYIVKAKHPVLEKVLIFNHINRIGKDFAARRNKKIIKSWLDVEILSFGLISGFGFFLSSKEIYSNNFEGSMDQRNTYPHWIYSYDGNDGILVFGVPITAIFHESDHTYLNLEWKSKKNHFSSDGVNDYLCYHKEKYKSLGARIFRARYFYLGVLMSDDSHLLKKILSFVVFSLLSPVQSISYVIRKYGI